MCNLLGSRAGACDKGRGAVEEASDDAMHSVGAWKQGRGRWVPEEDCGSECQRQLSAVLGKSEVLRNGRGDRQAVLMGERSSAGCIRSAADKEGH
jgi:hypothetical protein